MSSSPALLTIDVQVDFSRDVGAAAIDTVAIAGANFPNCPRTTLYEASERDFHTVLVTDALSRIYERGIAECTSVGAQAKTVRETAAWLGDM